MKRKTRHGLRKMCNCPDYRRGRTCSHPYHASFTHEGIQYRRSLGVSTRDDAKIARAQLVAEIARQPTRIRPTQPTTVADLLEHYRRGVVRLRSSGQQLTYQYHCAAIEAASLAGHAFGTLRAEAVTDETLIDFREARATRKNVARNRQLRILRSAYAWAVRRGVLPASPFADAEQLTQTEPPRERRLHDGEEATLRRHAPIEIDRLMTGLLETGCRPGELASLQWRDVRWETKQITIRAAKSKTAKARTVRITPKLGDLLRRLPQHGPDAYPFGEDDGQPRPVSAYRAAWAATTSAAESDDLHLHDLRREAASRWLESGVYKILDIAFELGHTRTATTETYLAQRENRQAELGAAYDALEAEA